MSKSLVAGAGLALASIACSTGPTVRPEPVPAAAAPPAPPATCTPYPTAIWRVDVAARTARLRNIPFAVRLPKDWTVVATTDRAEHVRMVSPQRDAAIVLAAPSKCGGSTRAELAKLLAPHPVAGTEAPVLLTRSLGESEHHLMAAAAACGGDQSARVACSAVLAALEAPSERLYQSYPAIDSQACGDAVTYRGSSWTSPHRPSKGTVVLRIVIDAQGNTTDVRVVQGSLPELEEGALRAIRDEKACRFKPARATDGTPLAFVIRGYTFRLERDSPPIPSKPRITPASSTMGDW